MSQSDTTIQKLAFRFEAISVKNDPLIFVISDSYSELLVDCVNCNKKSSLKIGDLLSTSIEDVIKSIPVYEGEIIHILPDGEEIRAEAGPRVDFWEIADKHYRAIEKEMGNENPPSIYEALKHPSRKEIDE